MKIFFVFIFLLFFFNANCQNRPLKIVLKSAKFEIENEDSVIHFLDKIVNPDTTRANLKVNNDENREIFFTNAKLNGHDLKILLHTTSPAYHQEYLISISNGKYRIKYNFKTSGDPFDRTIKSDNTILELNTLKFNKGDTVRGYTEFHGKCFYKKDPDYPTEILNIKGNFKFIIK
jgi:hypothetical protein